MTALSRKPGWPFSWDSGPEPQTIREMQEQIESSQISSVELTRFYLERIAGYNPLLHAITTVNTEALAIAESSDRIRRRDGARSVLEGVPVVVKDNIDTRDTQPTSAGSFALLLARPALDAGAMQRLRKAGAVPIGKANMTRWADFVSPHAMGGWSATGGQTLNPHVLDRTPSGSSSGSVAAVAACLAPAALGTETDGSIVNPSGACGVVGIKPSRDLVGGSGVVPISQIQDVVGTIARTVEDAAALLSVIQGPDDRDPHAVGPTRDDGYRTALDPDALGGKRIGIWRSLRHREVNVTLRRSIEVLRAHGAEVVDVELDVEHARVRSDEAKLFEFKAGIDEYLAATPGEHPGDLAGLIEFNRMCGRQEMARTGQPLFEAAQATGGDLDSPIYREHRSFATRSAQREIDLALKIHRLDAIMAPTNVPARPLSKRGPGSSRPAAIAGYPSVTVPAGWAWGKLPLGMSFFGGAWSEERLISIAYAFEQATQALAYPAFRRTLKA